MLIALFAASLLFWLCGILPQWLLCPFIEIVLLVTYLWVRYRHRIALISNVLILFTSTLLALSIGDIILRSYMKRHYYYRPEEWLLKKSEKWRDSYRFEPNQSVSQKVYGDLANFSCDPKLREEREIEFITDSYGFRNLEDFSNKSIDILLLGDSYTYGSGTTQSKTFSSLIAKRLDKKVYNLAVPGSPREEVVNLQAELTRLKIDSKTVLIWTIFEGNDLFYYSDPTLALEATQQSLSEQLITSYKTFQLNSPILKLSTALLNGCTTKSKVISREIAGFGPVLFLKAYEGIMSLSAEELKADPGWLNIVSAFNTMHELAKSKDFQVLLVVAPTKAQVYVQALATPSALSNLLKKQAEAFDFDFIDLKPAFIEASKVALNRNSKLLWWKDDTHWNIEGHAIVADILTEHLIKNFGSNSSQILQP